MTWLDSIEAHTQAQAKYDRDHTTRFCFKFNNRTDADVIQWIWKQSSRQGAIKRLVREEIAREKEAEQHLRNRESM